METVTLSNTCLAFFKFYCVHCFLFETCLYESISGNHWCFSTRYKIVVTVPLFNPKILFPSNNCIILVAASDRNSCRTFCREDSSNVLYFDENLFRKWNNVFDWMCTDCTCRSLGTMPSTCVFIQFFFCRGRVRPQCLFRFFSPNFCLDAVLTNFSGIFPFFLWYSKSKKFCSFSFQKTEMIPPVLIHLKRWRANIFVFHTPPSWEPETVINFQNLYESP